MERGVADMTAYRVEPTAYWVPRHYVQSAWVEHAPFAYWLVSACRPRSIVELGTHNGFSLFVFAEAVRRLELECTIDAVDSWEGDDHAGYYGEEVYASVAAIVDAEYASFTRLNRAYFDDAVTRFADGSIDLLHIDGRHGYDDVKADFETYAPKLSDRAVVIFHDTHEFQEGFGVHRFWDELAPTRPSINFHHGHGLGVLAYGPNVPEPVLAFLADAAENPELIRRTYEELGKGVDRLYDDWLERQRVAYLEELLAATREEVRHIQQSTSWKVTAPLRAVGSLVRRSH